MERRHLAACRRRDRRRRYRVDHRLRHRQHAHADVVAVDDGKLAVAVVSIPHLIGTALRFWMMKGRVDRRVLWRFGLASAAGGLAGALLQSAFDESIADALLAVLLLFVAASELTGLSRRMRVHADRAAWIAGVLSGVLGGLVGNQGGIRSAALLGFRLRATRSSPPPRRSRCSSTARACRSTSSRTGAELWAMRRAIAIATAGVVAGTIVGRPRAAPHSRNDVPEVVAIAARDPRRRAVVAR